MSKVIAKYKDWWDIYDELPKGWIINKNADSPVSSSVFIHDKPPIKGGKTAILMINGVSPIGKKNVNLINQ